MATIQTGIITDVGKGILADLTANLAPSKWPLYIGWGTSSTTPVSTLTGLVSEGGPINYQRKLATVTDTTLRLNLIGTWTIYLDHYHTHNEIPIYTKEAGLFDSASGGNMVAYWEYGAANKQPQYNGDTYNIRLYLLLEQG